MHEALNTANNALCGGIIEGARLLVYKYQLVLLGSLGNAIANN